MNNADESKYKFFDKRFLVMPDDEDIIGKKVFYSDKLYNLIALVDSGDFSYTDTLINIVKSDYCFEVANARWILAYYDPSYEARVAYSQGRTIEYRRKGNDEWHVSTGGVIDVECYDYRVKPDKWYVHEFTHSSSIKMAGSKFYKDNSNSVYVEFEGTKEECDKWIKEHTPKTRRMTNKELARWLADNKGQYSHVGSGVTCISYSYSNGDDAEVPMGILIREWDSDEWHEPLVEAKE